MTRRLVTVLTTFIMALSLAAAAAPAVAAQPVLPSYVVPGEGVFPEGIAYRPGTGDFFVGSAVNGTIYRGNVARRRLRVFLPGGHHGRTEALGMKVDAAGRLFVAGGSTGRVFVYDTDGGNLLARFATGPGGFLNDIALTPTGTSFITDSIRPVLYRIPRTLDGVRVFRRFAGSPLRYEEGFNLNGIVATPGGRYLLAVQSNTGKLFRFTAKTGAIRTVRVRGANVAEGDGMVLDGRGRLFVVRNQRERIAVLRTGAGFSTADFRRSFTDRSFLTPTTAVKVGDALLVVNAQFNGPGQPPFTVSGVPIP